MNPAFVKFSENKIFKYETSQTADIRLSLSINTLYSKNDLQLLFAPNDHTFTQNKIFYYCVSAVIFILKLIFFIADITNNKKSLIKDLFCKQALILCRNLKVYYKTQFNRFFNMSWNSRFGDRFWMAG